MSDPTEKGTHQLNDPNRQSTRSEPIDDARSETPIDKRAELYEHILPEKTGLLAEEWERKKNDAITKAVNHDLKKYGFSEPPKDPRTAEEWRREQQTTLFRKVKQDIFAYHEKIKALLEGHTDEDLDECIAEIKEEEDSYKYERPRSMISHKEWSQERQRQRKKYDEEEAEGETTRVVNLEAAGGPPKGWDRGLDSTINEVASDVPDGIRAIHKTMCVVMFQWWESGFSKKDSETLAKLNSQLDSIEGGKRFKVPPTEIALWMPKLKNALEMCEDTPSETSELELLKTAITLTNKLRKPGLDWKMVISRDTHRRFFDCINGPRSEEVETMRLHFEEEYLKPRPDQLKALAGLELLGSILINEKSESAKRIRLENIPVCMEQCRMVNQKVQLCNSRLGLRRDDHNLPLDDLEAAHRSYIGAKTSEAVNFITKFTYKADLLSIPGLQDLGSACIMAKGVCDTMEAHREAMDLSTAFQLSQLVEDLPSLSVSRNLFAFPGVPIKTVGWGDFQGRFYINQYGPRNASAWRIERYPTQEWTLEYGSEPPPAFCVTNITNRYGEEVEKPSGKKKYGSSFVGAWYGVAFEGQLQDINPHNYDLEYYKDSGMKRPRYPRCYILVGWGIQQQQKCFEKRWETRATIRRFHGTRDGDVMIYNNAVQCENRLRKYMRGDIIQETPEHVYREQEQSIKQERSEDALKVREYEDILPITAVGTTKGGLNQSVYRVDIQSRLDCSYLRL